MEGGTLQKKRCSKAAGEAEEDAKVAVFLLGFSTDLWQTFFTLSQRRRSEITRSPQSIQKCVLNFQTFQILKNLVKP